MLAVELRRAVSAAEADVEDALREYERAVRGMTERGLLEDPEDGDGGLEIARSAGQTFERSRRELEDALRQLGGVGDVGSGGGEERGGGSVNEVVVKHGKEVLEEYDTQYRALRRVATEYAERRALLADSLRRASDPSSGEDGARARSILEKEREGLSEAHASLDELLNLAGSSGESLRSQRRTLQGSMGTLEDFTSRIPVLGDAIRFISSRRRRDSYIVAAAVALCAILLIWAILAKM